MRTIYTRDDREADPIFKLIKFPMRHAKLQPSAGSVGAVFQKDGASPVTRPMHFDPEVVAIPIFGVRSSPSNRRLQSCQSLAEALR